MIPNRRLLIGCAVVIGSATLAWLAWKLPNHASQTSTETAKPALNPAASKGARDEFDRMLMVLTSGGNVLEIENAIGFLDTVTRNGKGLKSTQRAELIAALQRGKPAAMLDGSWSHLFNCACNALATGQPAPDEVLLGLLERVAVNDASLVLRLFALQHIGRHFSTASQATQQRLRSLVRQLMNDPSSQTAGTALTLWREWEKSAGPTDLSSFDLSHGIAADHGRPVDVRVAALHAIGDDSRVLGLARTIAVDRSQPVILRKVALNLIGRHGDQEDLAALRQCSKESPRLAQAGEPAARSLENRLAGITSPVLRPY